MPGQFLPADHSQGDANTIGGYMAVHGRPAAFEGSDGLSYSVEICTDDTGDPAHPYAAYFMFLRWRRIGEQRVDGHLETDFLAHGNTEMAARDAIGRMVLSDVRAHLERMIRSRASTESGSPAESKHRWWDATRAEGGV